METTAIPQFYQYLVNNPTIENAKYFQRIIKERASSIVSSGKDNLTLTSIFALIGRLNAR